MYHSFLIHLSADGHLGCFHILAIINSENTGSMVIMTIITQKSTHQHNFPIATWKHTNFLKKICSFRFYIHNNLLVTPGLDRKR